MNKACNLMIGNMNLAKFWTSGYKRLLNPDQGSQHDIDIVKIFKINLTDEPTNITAAHISRSRVTRKRGYKHKF